MIDHRVMAVFFRQPAHLEHADLDTGAAQKFPAKLPAP
jgi:hypothetical protein